MFDALQHPNPSRWQRIASQLTDRRRLRIENAAMQRTNHIRLVLQDIHHPHNVSACMRSAEALGVLNVDLVLKREKFSPSTVAHGVHHWLRISKFDEVDACVASLRAQG